MILYLKDCNSSINPISVDFSKYNKQNKYLIKSCGVKNRTVLDCTAGLCRDSFIIACKNYKVTAIEKNKIIYNLVKDGFDRGFNDINLFEILKNINFLNYDSINFLENTTNKFDCIYLDPMFEESKKSRLVKKEMQIFHRLADKTDNEKLFNLAFRNALNRVVIKRPLHGDNLINNKPSFSIYEKTIRFDIYLKNDQL